MLIETDCLFGFYVENHLFHPAYDLVQECPSILQQEDSEMSDYVLELYYHFFQEGDFERARSLAGLVKKVLGEEDKCYRVILAIQSGEASADIGMEN